MAVKSKFAKRLAGMQKKYDAAQTQGGGGESNLEPGRYKVKIAGELKEFNGVLKMVFKYTVIEGDFEGESIESYENLELENSMGYLKKKVKMFGFDPDDVNLADNLEDILAQVTAAETVGIIQVKQNGDYMNVYLNKVELDEEAEEGDEEEAEDDTDAGEEEETEESEDEESDEEDGEEEEEEESDSEDEEEEESEEEEEEEEAEEEAEPIVKGSTVLFQAPKTKKAVEFEVLSVNEKAGTAKLKGYPTPVKLDVLQLVAEEEAVEEVDEDDDEEEGELEVGANVSIDVRGKKQKGKVVSIDEENETVRVKCGDKTFKVSAEQITLLD